MKNLINIMNGWYKQGLTLKMIYDNTLEFHSREDAGLIFYEFVKSNKSNKDFMKEFNKTAFF